MRLRKLSVVSVVLAVVLVACGGQNPGVRSSQSKTVQTDPVATEAETAPPEITLDTVFVTDDTDPPDTVAPATNPLGFDECDAGVVCGYLDVPIDYANPDNGSFQIYIAIHLATDPAQRIGSLLVNPGGPGFGGSAFAFYADGNFGERLLEQFDIVAWDPRGTGESEPAIDCVDDYDRYFAATDITPDDDAERQQIIDLAKEFEDLCATKNADILQFIGTNNAARDMDAIRAALGEDKISYLGFSYGSELGASWATLFPDTVRAAVLDGAVDPNADFLESGLQQSKGFEDAVATFLADCGSRADCAFAPNGNAEAAFDTLMADLDETPIPSEPGRPNVTRGVALSAVVEAMYSQSSWPILEQALADAQNEDGAGLLALYDEYFQRGPDGVYDNSLEAFQTISCMDQVERPTVAEDDATAPQFVEVAPRTAPGTTGGYFCSFYPPTTDPRVEITGKGAGPIVVIGTTGDPATPLSGTENMAKALEQGVLVVVVADQHTGYGVNTCVNDAVENYLVDLTVPENGLRCE